VCSSSLLRQKGTVAVSLSCRVFCLDFFLFHLFLLTFLPITTTCLLVMNEGNEDDTNIDTNQCQDQGQYGFDDDD